LILEVLGWLKIVLQADYGKHIQTCGCVIGIMTQHNAMCVHPDYNGTYNIITESINHFPGDYATVHLSFFLQITRLILVKNFTHRATYQL
jgi:hypothetical protein